VLKGIYSYNSFKPLGLPLGVKAKVNKLNSPRIDWRHKLGQGIGLLFRLNIVANKEYCLTIIVQRLLIDILLLTAPAVL
jgi:predicted metal-dependent peptidase